MVGRNNYIKVPVIFMKMLKTRRFEKFPEVGGKLTKLIE